MKRIVSIIAMLSALSVAENLHAQCTDCEVKGINTDPRGSNAQNCEDANKINQFYWFNSQINAFYSYAGGNITGNLNSPFWAVGSQPIIGAHAGQTGSDFYPEDGWELLKFDNGYLADNTTQRSTAKSMIYLCYYNKHRGLMRFFGMMPDGGDYQIIRFRVELPQWKQDYGSNLFDHQSQKLSATNLLSIQGSATQPLDQETEENVYDVVTAFPGGEASTHWFWFDLPVAYDPCVCYNDIAIALTAHREQFYDITLKGWLNGAVIQQTQVDPNGYNKLVANRVLGAVTAAGVAIATGGAIIQTSAFTGLLDIFKNKPGVSASDQAAMGTLQSMLNNMSNFAYDEKEGKWRNFVTNDSLSKKDWVEIFAGINKFLTGMYDYANPNANAQRPSTTIIGSLDVGGTGTFTTPSYTPIYWGLPGSKMSKTLDEEIRVMPQGQPAEYFDPEYPLYNEVLGTFALLKTPVINKINEVVMLCDHVVVETDPIESELPPIQTGGQTAHFKHTLQLAEDLIYYFNPNTNINLDNTKISVAYVISPAISAKFFNINNIQAHPTIRGMTFCNQPLQEQINLAKTINMKNNILNDELTSPYIPIDQFKELVVTFILDNNFSVGMLDEKIYLRFLIEYESNDLDKNGTPIRNTQIFTFPVNIDIVNAVSSSIIDIMKDDNGHYFSTPTTFTDNEVLFYNGLVTISDILNTNPVGLNKKIYSLTGFELLPGAQIFDDIELHIGYPLGYQPQPMQNANFVESFCKNQIPWLEYKAKDFTAASVQRMQEEERDRHIQEAMPEDSLEPTYIPYKLQPNPNSGIFDVTFNRVLSTSATLTITDLTGRFIHTQTLVEGQRSFNIHNHNLESGIYLVTITQYNERKTQKMVIQAD